MASLRHARLLRITNMLLRGHHPPDQRVVVWKRQTYSLAHLETERQLWSKEHPNWDRIWRPMRIMEKQNHRWRNSVGRRLRRMYFAPLARGVTTFYSAEQMKRLRDLTMPRNIFSPHPRKLTFEEFKKVWIR
jgi:hypothetical protein